MIRFCILVNSVYVHPGMQKNLHKRNRLCEDQPNIDHLYVGCGWKTLRNTDEESGKYKEGSEVDSDNSLKEEVFKEVCGVDNDEDENSRQVDCKDGIINSSFEYNFDVNSF